MYVIGTLTGKASIVCPGSGGQIKSYFDKSTNAYVRNFVVAKFDASFRCLWVRVGEVDKNVDIRASVLFEGGSGTTDSLFFSGTIAKGATFFKFLGKTEAVTVKKDVTTVPLPSETAFVTSITAAGGVGKNFFNSFKDNVLNDAITRIHAMDIDAKGENFVLAGESIGQLSIPGKDPNGTAKTFLLKPDSFSNSQAFLVYYNVAAGSFVWADAYSTTSGEETSAFYDVAFSSDGQQIFVTGQVGYGVGKFDVGMRRYNVSTQKFDAETTIDPGTLKSSRGVKLKLIDQSATSIKSIVAIETEYYQGVLGQNRSGFGEKRTSLWIAEWTKNVGTPKTKILSNPYPYWRPRTMQVDVQKRIIIAGAIAHPITQTSVRYGTFAAIFSEQGSLLNSVNFQSSEKSTLEDVSVDGKGILRAVGYWKGSLAMPPLPLSSTNIESSFIWRYYLEP